MSESIELSPLDDIEAVSFNSGGEEFYYPETYYCAQCQWHWHRPWFQTPAQFASANARTIAGQSSSCLIYAVRDTPGNKTLRGQHYEIGYASADGSGEFKYNHSINGIFFIKYPKQKMRLSPKEM